MKTVVRNLFKVLLVILLMKLFIMPIYNLYYPSQSVRESKKVGAYVGECKILKVDTFAAGYEFPIEKIWVEKYYSLGRNRLGMVERVIESDKRIIIDIIKRHPFFKKYNFSDEWVIKDSLAHRVGTSHGVINLECPYQHGDTVIFNVFKLDKENSNVWRDETMELLFKVYTVCEWEKE